MKLQTRHALFFVLTIFLVVGILAAFYYFFLIQRGSPKGVKAALNLIDFDGDKKTDFAVYRAKSGAWFIIPSSGGETYTKAWGGDASDKPVTMNLSSID